MFRCPSFTRAVGGTPLLLIHGYPETKRIWWRNIEALAAAGFEVIAPDLRGVGDSDIPPDDRHDIVVYSRDLHALVHDGLGHASCVIAASDVGGVVATDMIHRYPGLRGRVLRLQHRSADGCRLLRNRIAERCQSNPTSRIRRGTTGGCKVRFPTSWR